MIEVIKVHEGSADMEVFKGNEELADKEGGYQSK